MSVGNSTPARIVLCALCCLALALPPFTYSQSSAAQTVWVAVQVRDAQGAIIRDLRLTEISLLEDNHPQQISSLRLEDLDSASSASARNSEPGPDYDGHRLLILYLDLTTMAPGEAQAAIESARLFVDREMRPSDLVGVASLANSLQVNTEFTDKKDAIKQALGQLDPTVGVGHRNGAGSSSSDDASNTLNNADRSLIGVQSVCDMLAGWPEPKSVIFYSSGIQRQGSQNEITLRSAVNAAVKAGVALESIDARLLPARAGGGGAARGSASGQGALNGQSTAGQLAAQYKDDETLSTLSRDSSGQALIDSGDDQGLFQRIEDDSRYFYLIGYTSTNAKQDGKYRKVTLKVDRPGVKLSYRPGYFAPKK